jgi:hypothetical protein
MAPEGPNIWVKPGAFKPGKTGQLCTISGHSLTWHVIAQHILKKYNPVIEEITQHIAKLICCNTSSVHAFLCVMRLCSANFKPPQGFRGIPLNKNLLNIFKDELLIIITTK